MFSLESHHRGDSNEYTQHTISNIIRKSIPNLQQLWDFAQVRNSRGKLAISVLATEVLL